MYVRVVNGTVRSSRTGGAACTTCVPVQTFRTTATSGTAVAVTDHVGGEAPGSSDAVINPGSGSSRIAHHGWPRAAVRHPGNARAAAVTISGIDFGFNFDTVVNTRDVTTCAATNSSYPCQGSLRQFVINANALGGEGALAQSGSGQIDGSTSFLPSGFESSIFMIPNGAANAGQNTAYANQLSGRRRGDHADRRAACDLGQQHASRRHHADRERRQHQRRHAGHGRHRRRGCHFAADLSAAGSAALGGRHRASR